MNKIIDTIETHKTVEALAPQVRSAIELGARFHILEIDDPDAHLKAISLIRSNPYLLIASMLPLTPSRGIPIDRSGLNLGNLRNFGMLYWITPSRMHPKVRVLTEPLFIEPILILLDSYETPINFTTLLLIIDLIEHNKSIPVYPLLYKLSPQFRKDLMDRPNIEKDPAYIAMALDTLNEEGIEITPDQTLEDWKSYMLETDPRIAEEWKPIETTSHNIGCELARITEGLDMYTLKEIKNWFSHTMCQKIPIESGTYSLLELNPYQVRRPEILEELLPLWAYLSIDDDDIIKHYAEGTLIYPTANAVIVAYIVLEALIINEQRELELEFIEYLEGLGIQTDELDSYKLQI